MKVTNNKSSHNNKRHFIIFLHLFSLKYRNAKRHYLQRNHHTTLHPTKRSVRRSVGPAAGLRSPPLTRSVVAVHAAAVSLAWSTVQNVLDVLHYQVDGHCRKQRWLHRVFRLAAWLENFFSSVHHLSMSKPGIYCKLPTMQHTSTVHSEILGSC